jgi:hypothetical protein
MVASTTGSPASVQRRESNAAQPRAKRARRLAIAALLVLAGGLGAREAIHRVPWFGPWLANGLRGLLGPDAVSWLEEQSADVEDRYRRTFRSGEAPRSIEQASPALSSSPLAPIPEPASVASTSPPQQAPRFRPVDVGPMAARVAAAGDGLWRAVPDPARSEATPLLYATLLHPDVKRPWSEVFVVATDTSQVGLYAVAGTREPEATTVAGESYQRRGRIPEPHLGQLLAAFNGGFMTQHGRHGMRVDGVTLVSARPHLCTLIALEDGALTIGTWRARAPEVEQAEGEGRLRFWRQGAPCMYEAGTLNPRLEDEEVRNWGATLDGQVVIRRSAVGLDPDRRVLYVAVSNDTTARAIAQAMRHAGASDVMQLDVNWSYPKFLLFPSGSDGQRRAHGLFEGFVFHEDEYVRRSSPRDFFYVIRR